MRLSLPLIASQLIYAISGFIATIMVAHLGRAELATNVLVWGVFITLILFFIGILTAVSILVAQSYGARDIQGIRQATVQGIILAFIFAVPMMLAMLVAPEVLIWTKQNPVVIKLAIPYFYSFIWCMLPLNLLVVMEQFLIGIARTRLVLIVSILEVPLEIFFFYTLLFGKWGMPRCGLAGIGYGVALAVSIIVICMALFLHFSPGTRKYMILGNCWQVNKKYLFELIRVGLPLGGMYCIEIALFTTVAFMMGRFGEDVLAAHQIAYQCFIFALTVIFGVSQGATVRVGHEVGRNNREALLLAAYVNMGLGFCFMLILAFLYIGVPNVIISMDINVHLPKYKMLVHYAKVFLAIAAILQLTDSIRYISAGALRGLKDTKIPMYISFIAFWLIAFPAAYILAFPLHLNGAGIWWGLVVGLAIGAMILLLRFNRLAQSINLEALVTRQEE
jgi:MATE family multidrug resistance protein